MFILTQETIIINYKDRDAHFSKSKHTIEIIPRNSLPKISHIFLIIIIIFSFCYLTKSSIAVDSFSAESTLFV